MEKIAWRRVIGSMRKYHLTLLLLIIGAVIVMVLVAIRSQSQPVRLSDARSIELALTHIARDLAMKGQENGGKLLVDKRDMDESVARYERIYGVKIKAVTVNPGFQGAAVDSLEGRLFLSAELPGGQVYDFSTGSVRRRQARE